MRWAQGPVLMSMSIISCSRCMGSGLARQGYPQMPVAGRQLDEEPGKQQKAHSSTEKSQGLNGCRECPCIKKGRSFHEKHSARKDEILGFKRTKCFKEYISPGVRTGAKAISGWQARGRVLFLALNVSGAAPMCVPTEDGRALQMHGRKPQNWC